MATEANIEIPPQSLGKDEYALPQYGFGTDIAFENLLGCNPFLFRVHTPKAHTPQSDASEPYFVGPKYDDALSAATFHSPFPSPSSFARSLAISSTYADVVQHLDWTTRSSSPYVSTSFSFAWAIWEAIRRYHFNIKHGVEIAVIDAKAVAGRAVTAAELLTKGAPQERHKDHWKWYRFAVESQDVLVWGYIPENAVLASIPLLQVLGKLPSYFLHHDISESKDSPFSRLGWDYTNKKPSYRRFCQEMSDHFLRMPVERRLRDATTGSVRLALCLLRPHFHKHISDDFVAATAQVCELAFLIAHWPNAWWARERPEIRDLVRCIVHIIGEEVREAKRVQALADSTRMQQIVGGLEQLVQAYEARSRSHRTLPEIHASCSPTSSSSLSLVPSPTSTRSPSSLCDIKVNPDPDSTVDVSFVTESKAIQTDLLPSVCETTTVTPTKEDTYSGSTLESVLRTTSCLLTGFFVGSFITLCVVLPRKRELLLIT